MHVYIYVYAIPINICHFLIYLIWQVCQTVDWTLDTIYIFMMGSSYWCSDPVVFKMNKWILGFFPPILKARLHLWLYTFHILTLTHKVKWILAPLPRLVINQFHIIRIFNLMSKFIQLKTLSCNEIKTTDVSEMTGTGKWIHISSSNKQIYEVNTCLSTWL